MKLPLSWLAEWVDWPREWGAPELARRLTLAGFEIEGIAPAAAPFSGVVVAKIVSVERHPQADKLQVCRVSSGAATAPLQIVCGAANARVGLVTALATVGAHLPGEVSIRAAKLRGVESQGMLCSARELGLAEGSAGILELPPEAPLGADLRSYLDLDDVVLEVNVTPNRGDALSVLGMAREVAALAGTSLHAPLAAAREPAPAAHEYAARDRAGGFTISVEPASGAGRLLGRVLRDIDNARATPLWMRERLRRAGVRAISAVVDVTNYVMLELGQPMHAYDLALLHGGFGARRARSGERLRLLDGRDIELTEDVLVIADREAVLGLAGIMGGERTAISADTREVALEVAWFDPAVIAGRARRYGLATDASQRFERGVDWRGQQRALERATELILSVSGGRAGPALAAEHASALPRTPTVRLRAARLERLLGARIAPAETERRLRALGMSVSAAEPAAAGPGGNGSAEGGFGAGPSWTVQPPSWRYDIALEEDLIEEVARLVGFDAIAEAPVLLPVVPRAAPSQELDERLVMRTLTARGYQEIITYAFVDPQLQQRLFGAEHALELANPIAADLAVMRSSLWPGLLAVARENLRRQQPRLRLFELARRFTGGGQREQRMLSGLALGARLPEQWGVETQPVDFYDVKADLTSLLALTGAAGQVSFEPSNPLSCLHPGRSARILRGGNPVGILGELHPGLVADLELSSAPILFELDYARAFRTELVHFREISRFPRIRRDISITLPEQVTFASVRDRVTVTAASLLKELVVFDVYSGRGIEKGRKSIALGLILQELDRTLTDGDADRVVAEVLDDLRRNLDARLRE